MPSDFEHILLFTVAMLIIMILIPQLYPAIGGLGCTAIVAVLAAVLMVFMSKFAKERYVNKDTEEVNLKQMLHYVKENKYLRYGFLGIMLLSLTNMTNTVMNYFAIYCLGDLGMVSILSVLLALPSMFIAMFMPSLTKRFDKFHLLMAGVAGQTVMCVVCFFVGYENTTLFMLCMALRSIFYGVQLVLQLHTGDFVEYGEYITGKRLQGTAYSI